MNDYTTAAALFILNCHGGRKKNEIGEIEQTIKILKFLTDSRGEAKTEKEHIENFQKLVNDIVENPKESGFGDLYTIDELGLEDEFYLGLHKNQHITLSQIGELVHKVHPNTLFDWMLFACYGGHGHKRILPYLREGENYISFGLGNEITETHDFSHYVKTLIAAKDHYNGNFSARNVFLDFVTTDFNSSKKAMFESIPMITSKRGTFNPVENIIYGRSFTPSEKQLVVSALKPFKSASDVLAIMANLEKVKNKSLLSKMPGYETALSIGFLLHKQ